MKWILLTILLFPLLCQAQNIQDRIDSIKEEVDLEQEELSAFKKLRNEYIDNGNKDSIAHISYYIARWSYNQDLYQQSILYSQEAIDKFKTIGYSDYRLHNCYSLILKSIRNGAEFESLHKLSKIISQLPLKNNDCTSTFFISIAELGKIYINREDPWACINYLHPYIELKWTDKITFDNYENFILTYCKALVLTKNNLQIQDALRLYDSLEIMGLRYGYSNDIEHISAISLDRSIAYEALLDNNSIIKTCDKALAIIKNNNTIITKEELDQNINKFNALYRQKKYRDAFLLLIKLKSFVEESKNISNFDKMNFYQNLAEAYVKTDQHSEAQSLFNTALSFSEYNPWSNAIKEWPSIKYKPETLNLLYDYSNFLFVSPESKFNTTKIEFTLLHIDSLISLQYNSHLEENSTISAIKSYSKVYHLLSKVAHQKKDASLLWYSAEKSKGLLLHQKYINRKYISQNQSDALKLKIKELKSKIIQLDYKFKKQPDQRTFDSTGNTLASIKYERLQLIEALKHLEINNPLDIIPLNKANPKESQSILNYVYGQDSIYAIHITPNNKSYKSLASIKEVEALVATIFKDVSNSKSRSVSNVDLYNLLIGPLQKELEENILIIPDRNLSIIPWEALSDQDGDFLLEKHDISYAVSFTHYHNLESSNITGSFNIIAPEYDTSGMEDLYASRTRGNVEFKYLPYAQEELKNLSSNYNVHLLESTIPKETFDSTLSNSKIFHFTGHGYQDPEDYRFSFLALNDNVDQLESVLTVAEIESYKTNAELVVLNACNTGVGEMIEGEGVFSLARSFLKAGAKSVINSLWSIDDHSSSIITISFYKYLKEGHTKSYALSQAKRDYLNSDIPEYKKHPYYWAGLILIGNDAPLKFESGSSLAAYWWVLVLGLISFITVFKLKGITG